MSFPRYPKYKPSGVEWLGDVPEHWTVIQMKRVATIRYGIGEPPRYHDEGTPLVRATNVHAGRLFAEGLVLVDPREIPEQRIVWLARGDIIVVRSGAYTGDSAIIPDGFGPSIAGFDMVLKCHSARPRFVQFALLSNYLKEGQIDLEKMLAAQPHLNAEELGSCLLVLPDATEQTLIASFLDRETSKIDGLVGEQRRLIELLKEKRQAVISHAVTKGLNPLAPLKPSVIEWLGDVPEHWRIVPLRWASKCCSGDGLSSDKVESIDDEGHSVRVIGGNGLMGYTDQGNIDHSVLAVGRVGALCGNIHVVNPPAWITDNALILDPDSKVFDLQFLSSVLRIRNLNDIASKTAQPLITGTQLSDQRIPAPPSNEQREITAYLDHETAKLDTLTAEAERGIELLQERRTALISAAVTGQIDVRGLAETEDV